MTSILLVVYNLKGHILVYVHISPPFPTNNLTSTLRISQSFWCYPKTLCLYLYLHIVGLYPIYILGLLIFHSEIHLAFLWLPRFWFNHHVAPLAMIPRSLSHLGSPRLVAALATPRRRSGRRRCCEKLRPGCGWRKAGNLAPDGGVGLSENVV